MGTKLLTIKRPTQEMLTIHITKNDLYILRANAFNKFVGTQYASKLLGCKDTDINNVEIDFRTGLMSVYLP